MASPLRPSVFVVPKRDRREEIVEQLTREREQGASPTITRDEIVRRWQLSPSTCDQVLAAVSEGGPVTAPRQDADTRATETARDPAPWRTLTTLLWLVVSVGLIAAAAFAGLS